MKKLLFLLAFLPLLGLLACDCHHESNGTVFDKTTGQPLAGVTVNYSRPGHEDEMLQYQGITGTDGTFKVSNDLCANYMVTFGKPGYTHFTADAESDMVIYLDQE